VALELRLRQGFNNMIFKNKRFYIGGSTPAPNPPVKN